MAVVLAVDPGGTNTGIVVRSGSKLLSHRLVQRPGGEQLLDYCRRVRGEATELLDLYVPALLAVEGTNQPTGHMGQTSVSGLLDTAWVGGHVCAAPGSPGTAVVIVPPGGYGRMADLSAMHDRMARATLESLYPPELVGDREMRGKGKLKDCRSAWDLAAATEVKEALPP